MLPTLRYSESDYHSITPHDLVIAALPKDEIQRGSTTNNTGVGREGLIDARLIIRIYTYELDLQLPAVHSNRALIL
ncbi:MAG: hypothetical protein Q9179_005860, partial [Wetmoreana sp. 5 TL-2023]